MNNENEKIQSSKVEQKEKIDSLNLQNLRVNVSKMKKENFTKETSTYSKKELYIGLKELNSEDQKKFRQRIRNKLKRFVSAILGKDRSEKERSESIIEFLKFYKENWKIQDFKIENFSQSKNKADLKDYTILLESVKSAIE